MRGGRSHLDGRRREGEAGTECLSPRTRRRFPGPCPAQVRLGPNYRRVCCPPCADGQINGRPESPPGRDGTPDTTSPAAAQRETPVRLRRSGRPDVPTGPENLPPRAVRSWRRRASFSSEARDPREKCAGVDPSPRGSPVQLGAITSTSCLRGSSTHRPRHLGDSEHLFLLCKGPWGRRLSMTSNLTPQDIWQLYIWGSRRGTESASLLRRLPPLRVHGRSRQLGLSARLRPLFVRAGE